MAEHVSCVHERSNLIDAAHAGMIADDFLFARARGIAHADAHQEAVELRFGQRIGAVMLDGILRRENHEGLRQRMRVIIDGDLRFVHRLEQRGLRFRRGAVDFIGDDDVGEDRAGFEFEFLRGGIVDADADHVARKHVRGELDALERAVERAGERLRESRLADAGYVFDQQVAAREKGGERELDDLFLALHHARDRALKLGEAAAGGGGRDVGRGLQLAQPSATKSEFPVARTGKSACATQNDYGRLAQWLERSPHTGEVQGSSPWSPTMPRFDSAIK